MELHGILTAVWPGKKRVKQIGWFPESNGTRRRRLNLISGAWSDTPGIGHLSASGSHHNDPGQDSNPDRSIQSTGLEPRPLDSEWTTLILSATAPPQTNRDVIYLSRLFSKTGLFHDKVTQKSSSFHSRRNKCHSWQILVERLVEFAIFTIQSNNSTSTRQYSESGYFIIGAISRLVTSRRKSWIQSGLWDSILPASGTFPRRLGVSFQFLFTLSERRDIVSITFVTSFDLIALEDKTEFNVVRHYDHCVTSCINTFGEVESIFHNKKGWKTGLILEIVPLKLFLDMVSSFPVDVTPLALRRGFRGGLNGSKAGWAVTWAESA